MRGRQDTYNSVKVAALSLKPTKWNKDANADKLEAFFVEAAKEASRAIVATEGFLEGYVVMDDDRHNLADRQLWLPYPLDDLVRQQLPMPVRTEGLPEIIDMTERLRCRTLAEWATFGYDELTNTTAPFFK